MSLKLDPRHLGVYVNVLSDYLEAADDAEANLAAVFLAADAGIDTHLERPGFAAAQALLSACASVSKLLWSPGHHPDAKKRSRALRTALQVTEDDFPLLCDRELRNDFEHYDERLDTFLAREPPMVRYRMVTKADSCAVYFEGELIPALGMLQSSERSISYLERKVRVDDLMSEMHEIGRRIGTWRGVQT